MRPVRSTRRVFASFLCVLASALFIPAAELSARAAPAGSPAPLSGSLLVVENAGQFDPAVRFQVEVIEGPGGREDPVGDRDLVVVDPGPAIP